MDRVKIAAALFALAALSRLPATAQTSPPLTVSADGFYLRGKPFRIVSGEMEYARIPRELWRDRLQKARAMGLNAITVYVFWNLHEPTPGTYDFSGQNDVAAFLREAQQAGLFVILSPGPYVCAEWDLGGYPAWLLRDPALELRSLDPKFMQAATRWMHRLGQELAPLQADRGGPILAVQVENEFGSFGKGATTDRPYLQAMYQLVQQSGFTGSLLYTADGADQLPEGSLPSVFAGIDFGTGDANRSIALARKTHPGEPIYVAEYWDGWFDHWGDKHQVTNGAQQVAEVRQMLKDGDSISLYMVHGGTSWGWMNGANVQAGAYQPDVSSYDYDAPLDESGRPRPKYFALRDAIAEATGVTPPPVPQSAPTIELAATPLTQSLPLWSDLPAQAHALAAQPLPMEQLGQNYGWVLYSNSVHLSSAVAAPLKLGPVHSYARVYLDGKLQGIADRRLSPDGTVPLQAAPGDHRLDILVENTGRINFTTAMRGEWAGLTGPVLLGSQQLGGWDSLPLPFPPASGSGWTSAACTGACFYRGTFTVGEPGDTFVDTSHFGKGEVWINGHLLGRFWQIGPMGTLYLPGVWLKRGENQIVIFDVAGTGAPTLRGVRQPIYLQPKPRLSRKKERAGEQSSSPAQLTPRHLEVIVQRKLDLPRGRPGVLDLPKGAVTDVHIRVAVARDVEGVEKVSPKLDILSFHDVEHLASG